MRAIAIVLLLVLWCGVGAASELTLEAADVMQFIDDSGGGHVLIKFSFPQELSSAKILRAIIEVDLQCAGARPGMVLYKVPVDWTGGTVNLDWWRDNKDAVSASKAAVCAPADCGNGSTLFEVGRWVRGWSSGATANYGMILAGTSAGDSITLESGESVRLTVTYVE